MRVVFKSFAGTAALAAALSSHPVSASDEPKFSLEPTSEWRLDEQSDRCRITRSFGSGKDQISLRIDQGGPEPFYTLTLVGRPVRHPYGSVIRIQFGPGEDPIYRGYISAKSNAGTPALVMYGVALSPITAEEAEKGIAPLSDERKSKIDRLSLSRSIVSPFALERGSMGEPLAKLQDCATALARKLDLPNMIKSGKFRPAKLTFDEDELAEKIYYPWDLVRQGMEGRIDFRLTVNAQGKPTACHILATNRPQMFDDAVCLSLMKNARFEPALDADGEPQASYFEHAISFIIR